MDWISDHHLSKLKHEESGMDGEKALPTFASQRNDIQEKCVKVCFLIWNIWLGRHEDWKSGTFYKRKNIESIFDRKLVIPIVSSKKIHFRLNSN